MNENGSILIVDDEKSIRKAVRRLLEADGHFVGEASSGMEAVEQATSTPFSCIILDLKMPGMDGDETFDALLKEKVDTPVIILTGHGDVPTAVDFLRRGAIDFIEKPPSLERLRIAVHNAIRTKTLTDKLKLAQPLGNLRSRIIGSSKGIVALKKMIATVAPSRAPVLITGESGTGKELVAHAIHHASNVRRHTFIRINCAAIPDELIESELFGHEKGSFTGAISRQAGKFVLADGGTIFLDEIGDMSLKAQAKVLRVIESSEVEPIGMGRTLTVNARILAATNKALQEEMDRGSFREDLFFRLNVVPIQVPPLRDHREDIPELVDHICQLYAGENNLPRRSFSKESLSHLQAREWKGNVRELKNYVERCLILVPDSVISPDSLPEQSRSQQIPLSSLPLDWKSFKRDSEKEYLIVQLTANDWNVAKTSRAIKIPRSHLYRLMESYKIERENS